MGYNFIADITGPSSFVMPLLPPKIAKSRQIPTKFDPSSSGSSKVIDLGVNRKLTCDFLLVINSNCQEAKKQVQPRHVNAVIIDGYRRFRLLTIRRKSNRNSNRRFRRYSVVFDVRVTLQKCSYRPIYLLNRVYTAVIVCRGVWRPGQDSMTRELPRDMQEEINMNDFCPTLKQVTLSSTHCSLPYSSFSSMLNFGVISTFVS